MATSVGITSRLSRSSKKQDLQYAFSNSSTALVSKLRQDGQLNTVESVMHAVEQVSSLLTSGYNEQIKDNILSVCQHLKVYGACLEVLYKEQLDRAFVVFRNSSQDEEKLDYNSRLHLLELIELRANQWKGTDVMNNYYKKKGHLENDMTGSILSESASSASIDSSAFMSPVTAPLLGPGEIMKSSGKFAKPTRIPGKNYCKDEVVIRNADSGKVMGIKGRRVHMIEELSETIISFQRVNPGAKERLVQITGANENSINHAKQLIEDTIRRNASPMRDPNAGVGALAGSSSSIASSASDESAMPLAGATSGGNVGIGGRTLLHSLSTGDANVGEYKYTVIVRGHTLKITGHNLDLVRMSKLVLDEFFSGEPINGVGEFYNFETLPRSSMSPNVQESIDADRIDEVVPNGQSDELKTLNSSIATDSTLSDYKPLRRPNITSENSATNLIQDGFKSATAKDSSSGAIVSGGSGGGGGVVSGGDGGSSTRLVYSMEFLARMAMSPLCVTPPTEWQRISGEHPSITRKVVEIFDADQYLSSRATIQHVLCTSASDESILSGSSV